MKTWSVAASEEVALGLENDVQLPALLVLDSVFEKARRGCGGPVDTMVLPLDAMVRQMKQKKYVLLCPGC